MTGSCAPRFSSACATTSRRQKSAARRFPPPGFLPTDKKEVTTEIDGHSLKFTNLDKIYYPEDGYTKRDLLNYYDSVAPLLLPYLKDRPLSLKRYPNGIHEQFFFQKNTPEGYPSWLRTETIEATSVMCSPKTAQACFT